MFHPRNGIKKFYAIHWKITEPLSNEGLKSFFISLNHGSMLRLATVPIKREAKNPPSWSQRVRDRGKSCGRIGSDAGDVAWKEGLFSWVGIFSVAQWASHNLLWFHASQLSLVELILRRSHQITIKTIFRIVSRVKQQFINYFQHLFIDHLVQLLNCLFIFVWSIYISHLCECHVQATPPSHHGFRNINFINLDRGWSIHQR